MPRFLAGASEQQAGREPKKRRVKPAPTVGGYSSTYSSGPIRSHQVIAEILLRCRADHLGIDVSLLQDPWNHPDLNHFYSQQWADISQAIKRYGNRAVLQVTTDKNNRWMCNPKYGDHPLRLEKIKEILRSCRQC